MVNVVPPSSSDDLWLNATTLGGMNNQANTKVVFLLSGIESQGDIMH